MPKTRTVANVNERAGRQLNDALHVRWTEAVLRDYTDDGQREIITLVPSANRARTQVTLVQGALQTTPSDCFGIIDIPFNVGGGDIARATRLSLDAEKPGWYHNKQDVAVEHFVVTDAPNEFLVYPAQAPGITRSVELLYGRQPIDTVNDSTALSIEDRYFNALVYYVVFRCLYEDADNTANQQRATEQLALFRHGLGMA